MDAITIFNQTSDHLKLQFLKEVLQKNGELRDQFLAWTDRPTESSAEADYNMAAADLISSAMNEMIAMFEDLDFEDVDWEDYVPRHNGYIPDYEAVEHMAEDQLDAFFLDLKESVVNWIKKGDLVHATCRLAGYADACPQITVEGADDVFGDFESELESRWEAMLGEIMEESEQVVFSDKQVIGAADILFGYFSDNHENENDWLLQFEPWLLLLVNSKNLAEKLLISMQEFGIREHHIPALTVRLYYNTGNPDMWIKKAEQFMNVDLDVARQLLDHLLKTDPSRFVAKGWPVFRLYKDKMAVWFKERLTPSIDAAFFTEVLWYLTVRKQDINLYRELRPLLDEKARETLIEQIRNSETFWAEVLTEEGRFDQILKRLKKDYLNNFHFTELITPLLAVYPSESFEMIRGRITHTLRQTGNRDIYQEICEWLVLARRIANFQEQYTAIVNELYFRKPTLRALRDEMRRAGLV
jgi:hypothetical protein